jgi:hypothetical protein
MRLPRSAQELGEMIATWLSVPGLQVTVHPDPFVGWGPRVIAAPTVAAKYQPLAEELAVTCGGPYELST